MGEMVETAETGLTVGMVQAGTVPITLPVVQVAPEELLLITQGNFIFQAPTSYVTQVSRTHYARGNAL
ncbi:hypothetical protein D3C80_1052350 [compost metagenome]